MKLCIFPILIWATSLLGTQAELKPIQMESLPGSEVWLSPYPKENPEGEAPMRVTIWFEKQFLGDGVGYQRRAQEFAKTRRTELRTAVIKALKKQSQASYERAKPALGKLQKRGLIGKIDRHWIVNSFTCVTKKEGLEELKKIPGVRNIFLRDARQRPTAEAPPMPPVPVVERPTKPDFKDLPSYSTRLKADQVWQEFGVAGQGTLNVIHDKNFIISPHLQRTIYRNAMEIPGNGKDDDGNGYIDDLHGYNFDLKSNQLYTAPFSGDPKDRRVLHGTNCANIVSGSGDGKKRPAFGIAPLSRWAGVINQGGIERSVEWAIEQGADTYSMSFSRSGFGEYKSHWRKVMEHGNFCGLLFVSGAGNVRKHLPEPYAMLIPQNIPEAVFAAAGVQQDLSRTTFSCIGPVTWNTQHYQDGTLQKPEVCAFNQQVVCQLPSGKIVPKMLNGNSYAGPMFCGTISLMLSADPDLLPWDLKEIITSTATDVGPKGIDPQTGHGLINCYAAVKEVLRRKALRN
ncbi:MAG: S8 family serine peptidase [Akkermansiaceae bacterium]